MKKLAEFAWEIEPITSDVSGHTMTGTKLKICDHEYNAWGYDTYIYDAIELVSRWKQDQVTYERVIHVRYWLRENIQHGHNIEFSHLKTLNAVKQFIDQVIREEYPKEGDADLKDSLNHDLDTNKKVLGSHRQLKQTL